MFLLSTLCTDHCDFVFFLQKCESYSRGPILDIYFASVHQCFKMSSSEDDFLPSYDVIIGRKSQPSTKTSKQATGKEMDPGCYLCTGRGQRRHRDRGTGFTPYIFTTLLAMKKYIYPKQPGCNKEQLCQKLFNSGEK